MGQQDNWASKREAALEKAKLLKEKLLQQEPTFLGLSGHFSGRQTYCCPFCPSGRGKHQTGISLIPRSNSSTPKYHCFACNSTASVIDLAMAHYNTDFKETLEILKQYYQIDENTLESPVSEVAKLQQEEEVTPTDIYECQNEYFNTCRKNLDPTYLEKRGISEKTQRHFWIGTDEKWVNPIKGNTKYPTKRCIIPTSSYSYLARDVREDKDIPEPQQRFTKAKYGTLHLFNEKIALNQPQGSVIYVVEGEIDAMSIFEISKGNVQAIGLGSTGNWNKFVQSAKTFGKDKYYILMLDNDNAGVTTSKKIADHLEAYGIKFRVQKYPQEYNDVNEMLQKDANGLKNCVLETLKVVKKEKMAQKAAELGKQEDIKHE